LVKKIGDDSAQKIEEYQQKISTTIELKKQKEKQNKKEEKKKKFSSCFLWQRKRFFFSHPFTRSLFKNFFFFSFF
jgi:lipopolysaccharide biosynthesis glycosyltransferase